MNVTRYRCSVLAVDDDPAVLAILAAQLAADFEVVTACSAGQARAILAQRSVDIVVSDLSLPDESGLDLLDWVRRTVPRTARVLLTGTARMQDAVDAINHSQVHRLLLKPWRYEDLLQALRTISRGLMLERSHEQLLDELREQKLELEQRVHTRTLELEQALRELQHNNQLLEKMAATDWLTNLPNRRAIEEIVRNELDRRKRTPNPIGLLMIDADHFGQVNKDHSQAGGDKVLEWLAGIFLASVRASDSVGRVGGEEFLVVAPATDLTGLETLAERLRANVETAETSYNGKPIKMTLSLGVAVADAWTATTYKDLYDAAADGLKAAKHSGRNRAVVRVLAVPPVA